MNLENFILFSSISSVRNPVSCVFFVKYPVHSLTLLSHVVGWLRGVLQRISIPHAIYMWVLGLFCTCVSLVPKYQTVLTFKSVSCSKFLRTSSVNNLHTNFFKLGLSHKKFLNIDRKMTESEESEREHGQRNLILLI